jgi:hypothetical protein
MDRIQKNKLYQYDEDQGKTVPYMDSEGLLDSFPYTISYIHEGQRSGFFLDWYDRGWCFFSWILNPGNFEHFPFLKKVGNNSATLVCWRYMKTKMEHFG